MKRKLDKLFESSKWFKTPIQTLDRSTLPIIWSSKNIAQPADFGEPLTKIYISFEYLDGLVSKFPDIICVSIVELILNYISAFNIVSNRVNNSTANLCLVCGIDTYEYKEDSKIVISCNRCTGFYCSFCWSESNHVLNPKLRLMNLQSVPQDSKLPIMTIVNYRYCPGCLCGLPFVE
jgi:hypothetical protein